MEETMDAVTRANFEEEIRSLEAQYDLFWNNADVESIVETFAEDVVVVSPFGETSVGIEAQRISYESLFAGLAKDSTHTSIIRSVYFITDGVALVDGEAIINGFREPDGSPMQEMRHSYTDVVIKKDDGWYIAHVRASVFMPRLPQ